MFGNFFSSFTGTSYPTILIQTLAVEVLVEIKTIMKSTLGIYNLGLIYLQFSLMIPTLIPT